MIKTFNQTILRVLLTYSPGLIPGTKKQYAIAEHLGAIDVIKRSYQQALTD